MVAIEVNSINCIVVLAGGVKGGGACFVVLIRLVIFRLSCSRHVLLWAENIDCSIYRRYNVVLCSVAICANVYYSLYPKKSVLI